MFISQVEVHKEKKNIFTSQKLYIEQTYLF